MIDCTPLTDVHSMEELSFPFKLEIVFFNLSIEKKIAIN
jgi:hypothetical protein